MIDYTKPVRVFKNPQRGCYSIMQGGAIKASARQILLKDAEFLVRESGRQRMLTSQKKNIHAYVVGELVDFARVEDDRSLAGLGGRIAGYNPYRNSAFVDCETDQPLARAEAVRFDESGMTYR